MPGRTVPKQPPYRPPSKAAIIGYALLLIGIYLLIVAPPAGVLVTGLGITLLLYSGLCDRITDIDNRLAETNRLLEQQNQISLSITDYLRDLRDRQQPPTVDPTLPENLPK